MVGAIAEDLFRPALAAVAGLLLVSSPISQTGGDLPITGDPAAPGTSRSAPAHAPVAADGGKIVYLIAIAALTALLAFTVWREFQAALHPGAR